MMNGQSSWFRGGGLLIVLGLLCAGSVHAQQSRADLRSLVAAEKAFAASSAREGVRRAFLNYLAEGAVLFRPHPVDGRRVWAGRPDPSFLLSWYPSYAEVSADGMLGFTTGPSVLTDTTGGDRQDWHGHFVTVWKRGADSAWKVVLDAGIGHAALVPPPPVFDPEGVPEGTPGVVPASVSLHDTVLALERSCGELAEKSGLPAAYARFARSDIRVYREGRLPLPGIPRPDSVSESGHAELLFAEVAGSGDMAYTYGKSTGHLGGTVAKAYYVRIWRPQRAEGWKIVLELWVPVPSQK